MRSLIELCPIVLRFINYPLDKGGLQDLIALCHREVGLKATVDFADAIKEMGFQYATVSGVTISVYDLTVPPEKDEFLETCRRMKSQKLNASIAVVC